MKVKDLIKALEDLKQPDKEVYFDDCEWGIRPVNTVYITDMFSNEPVVLDSNS